MDAFKTRCAAACSLALAMVAVPSAAATVQSNWAGYVATAPNIAFTSVAGTWSQPHVRCGHSGRSTSAVWVGLGGYAGESELEQIGTEADCDAAGRPTSYAWFALIPYPAHRIKLMLRAGDIVTASVTIAPQGIDLRLENRTRHWVFARSIATPAVAASAEWIVEAPVVCSHSRCHEPALANFGTVTLDDLSATGNGAAGPVTSSSWTTTPLELVPGSVRTRDASTNAGKDVELRLTDEAPSSTTGAVPDRWAGDGSGFTVRWHP
jgi:hypothetical protein